MKRTILVISNKWDAHADAVIRAIQRNGGSVIRINTEDFRQNKISFELQNKSSKWIITTPEDRVISKETIGGVYIRRLSMPIDVSDTQEQFQDFTRRESLAILDALEMILESSIWLNRPSTRKIASNKIYQLLLAQSIELTIPRTLITNDSDQARRFHANEREIIYKTIDCPMLDFGDKGQSMINTSIVPKNTDFSTIRLTPALLQCYEHKAYELRIHVIGTEILAIKIDSQKHPSARIDWRLAQKDLHYEQTTLPKTIEQKILQLMSALHIQFGIIDMIVTEGGEYVFLEINPDGNWLWIEQKIQTPISESIALYFLKNIGEIR